MLISFGMLLTRQQDRRNSTSFFLRHYQKGDELILKIEAPLIEKKHSFTTTATVQSVKKNNFAFSVKGKLNLIFKKNDTAKTIRYGDLIVVNNAVQPIKNFGNPGEFDNKRYNAFQQTYHQLYLKGKIMSATITWVIEWMSVKPTEGSYTDVVVTAGWRCNGVESAGTPSKDYVYSIYGSSTFPMPEGRHHLHARLVRERG
jgi:hypothetical protein